MTYYIQSHSRPINDMTFETINLALEFARAPAWPGAGATEITLTGPASYVWLGTRYEILEGGNPKAARAEARAETIARVNSHQRSAINPNGQFRGGWWLSREMDRADSDF